MNVGNSPVTGVYVGSTPVTAVYVGAQKIWPTTEVHEVSVSGLAGVNTAHPLVAVTVPAGQTWSVRVQGTMQSSFYTHDPQIRIGSSTSSRYSHGATVDYSGTITATNSTIALVTAEGPVFGSAGFTGTVTIEK